MNGDLNLFFLGFFMRMGCIIRVKNIYHIIDLRDKEGPYWQVVIDLQQLADNLVAAGKSLPVKNLIYWLGHDYLQWSKNYMESHRRQPVYRPEVPIFGEELQFCSEGGTFCSDDDDSPSSEEVQQMLEQACVKAFASQN